jgi:hypothetical protein
VRDQRSLMHQAVRVVVNLVKAAGWNRVSWLVYRSHDAPPISPAVYGQIHVGYV